MCWWCSWNFPPKFTHGCGQPRYAKWYLVMACPFLGSGLLGRRLQRRLCDFLPCPCSFAMSFWLFPPQHPIFWVIQQVLNKQPCHPYMFLSRVALYGSCAKTVWIGHVDKGRVVFHQFSHSSVKSQKHCYLQVPLQQLMPLFLYEVPLTSVWLKYKLFVQPKLHQETSHCHVAKRFAWCVALLVMRVECLLCFFWGWPDIGWKGGAGISELFRTMRSLSRLAARSKSPESWQTQWP